LEEGEGEEDEADLPDTKGADSRLTDDVEEEEEAAAGSRLTAAAPPVPVPAEAAEEGGSLVRSTLVGVGSVVSRAVAPNSSQHEKHRRTVFTMFSLLTQS
jgi:hypothetical protein